MLNVGEQLVSSYLRYIRGCDFIQTNLYTVESQGEIDVVGLNIVEQQVYVCEVAIHLTTGLQYVKNKRPNNIQKLTEKFSRDIEYARNYFDEYDQHFMLWSPIVKDSKGKSEYNQMRHLTEIQENIKRKYDIDIECIINEKFQECLEELRNYAKSETKALQCPLMRLMQVEEYLAKHVSNRYPMQAQANSHNELSFHHVARPAIDIQTEKHPEIGYSEFWAPIRNGELGELFAGKPVPIRDEGWISKNIRNIGVNLFLNKQQCYILLHFKGTNPVERREKVMALFPESNYEYEYRESPKEPAKVIFPVFNDKGKNDRDDWEEIREKLVNMGTDIYNKIDESGL